MCRTSHPCVHVFRSVPSPIARQRFIVASSCYSIGGRHFVQRQAIPGIHSRRAARCRSARRESMQKRVAPTRAKPADSPRRLTARSGQTQLVVAPANSGDVTLGGLADRGLTLAAFYETGVLERLRF